MRKQKYKVMLTEEQIRIIGVLLTRESIMCPQNILEPIMDLITIMGKSMPNDVLTTDKKTRKK